MALSGRAPAGDATQRERVRSWLESSQWLVREAENGRMAITQLEKEMPDIVLLDLLMPDMDGFELIAVLQGRLEWRHLPVIVITALDLSAADCARLSSGVEGILTKGSFDPVELVRTIRRIVPATKNGQPKLGATS